MRVSVAVSVSVSVCLSVYMRERERACVCVFVCAVWYLASTRAFAPEVCVRVCARVCVCVCVVAQPVLKSCSCLERDGCVMSNVMSHV